MVISSPSTFPFSNALPFVADRISQRRRADTDSTFSPGPSWVAVLLDGQRDGAALHRAVPGSAAPLNASGNHAAPAAAYHALMVLILRLALLLVVFAATPAAQAPRVTTPKEEFGFNFGDDYQLATYQQLAAYWQKLDRESDRMVAPGDRQDLRRPPAPDGHRHVAGESPEPGADQGHRRAASRWPRA